MVSIISAAVAWVAGALAITTAATWAILSVAVSVVVQQYSAARAKEAREDAQRKANAQADAAKGQQVVTEGNPAPLPVVYGRALIGGSRVYTNVFSNFTYVAPSTSNYFIHKAGNLIPTAIGSKNEYLISQQAICFNGIQACYNVDISGKRISGNNVDANNNVVYDGSGTLDQPYKDSAVCTVFCEGNYVDPTITANDTSRGNAAFTNTAYATNVFKLNRDEPQFSGVPDAQYYVFGKRIGTVTLSAGTYSYNTVSKVYSENPALVLLDYLTNSVYGRGLAISSIDLESFYNALLICDIIVVPSWATIGGVFWGGSVSIGQIKLYSCNLVLDSAKPIRENIELILGTMNDADLIWSSGKYKLLLDYPRLYTSLATYEAGTTVQYGSGTSVGLFRALSTTTSVPSIGAVWADAIDFYITDDDIVREGETAITWPNAQVRLNYATVRYLNESKDFTEDTVSWPSKIGSAVYNNYLLDDSYLPLETELFATGIINYQQALAKAEYTVRSSRTNVNYTFSVNRKFVKLEPGDFVKLTSEVLNIPGELLKVISVSPDSKGNIKVEARRFDATSLAWNISDTEIAPVRRIFNDSINQASSLTLDIATATSFLGLATLRWTKSTSISTTYYTVKYTTTAIGSITPSTTWIDIGSTPNNFFEIPNLSLSTYTLTVVANSNVKSATQTGWPTLGITSNMFIPGNITALTSTIDKDGIHLSWGIPSGTLAYYEVRYGPNWASSTLVQSNITETFLNIPPVTANTYNWMVKAVNSVGNYSTLDASKSDIIGRPAQASPAYRTVLSDEEVSWNIPASTFSIDRYEIGVGTTYSAALANIVHTTKSTKYVRAVDYAGLRTYWVIAYDSAGNRSTTDIANSSSFVTANILAPNTVTGFAKSIVANKMLLSWDTNATASPNRVSIKYYEVRYGASYGGGTPLGRETGTTLQISIDWAVPRTLWIAAVDTANNTGTAVSIDTTISAPSNPVPNTPVFSNSNVIISWPTVTSSLDIDYYLVTYGSPRVTLGKIYGNQISDTAIWGSGVTSRTYFITAYNINSNASAESSCVATVTAIPAPVVTPTILATDSNFKLTWTPATGLLPIDYYEIFDAAVSLGKTYSLFFIAKVNWSGNKTLTVKAVDINGNISPAGSATISIVAPSWDTPTIINAPLTVQTIDNNVLIYWKTPNSTLPIDTYEVRRSNSTGTYATSTLVGNKNGGFTSVFETAAGNYIYYVAGINSVGTIGSPKSIPATVAQPPDYVLKSDYIVTTYTGTTTRMFLENSRLLFPVDATVTWGNHFINGAGAGSWSTPNDQIVAGYPLYIQPPGGVNGVYIETIDYLTILPSSRVTVTYLLENIIGGVSSTCEMATSNDNINYSSYVTSTQLYLTNFRYLRIRIVGLKSISSSIGAISNIRVVLDAKLKTITGTIHALAPVSGTYSQSGTNTITVTASGTWVASKVVDMVFNTGTASSGAYVIVTGGSGTFTITSATIATTTGNCSIDSGGTLLYVTNDRKPTGTKEFVDIDAIQLTPQGTVAASALYDFTDAPNPLNLKVLLFNTSGTRINGTVSYMIRGF
jgi:hypothetical protein